MTERRLTLLRPLCERNLQTHGQWWAGARRAGLVPPYEFLATGRGHLGLRFWLDRAWHEPGSLQLFRDGWRVEMAGAYVRRGIND
jgi:hypothetical protein